MEEHNLSAPKTKSFKSYFFEFLMVFLAVTAGFFSENIREYFGDRNREVEYILSVSEDLRQDISMLDSIITARKKKDIMLDSLLYFINSEDPNLHGNDIYYYARWSPRTYRFFSHDKTLMELRNSSDWSTIRKDEVSKALQSYDAQLRMITLFIEHREETLIYILYPSLNKLFDNRTFNEMVFGLSFKRPTNNPKLLSLDKVTLNEFSNQIHFLKNANQYYIKNSTTLLDYAKGTLALIEREYEGLR